MPSRIEKIEQVVLQLNSARETVAMLEAELKELVGPARRPKRHRSEEIEEPPSEEVQELPESKVVVAPATGGSPKNASVLILRKLHNMRPGERLPFGELARMAYGEDSREARNRISAKLNYLKKRGRVVRDDDGAWVLAPSEGTA